MAAPIELIANNLKQVYPRPAISQAWLAETLAELLAHSPDLSRQLQIKGCHQALLRSHLGQSTAAGTGFPPALVDTADDREPLHDQLVFEGIKGCLTMVVGITEVGSSAFHLRKNLNERREARKGTARIRRLAGEDEDEDGDDAEANMRYPRGMLKLELSDGFSVCKAIEYKRMSALKLGETRLGTKVLLRNVRVLRGVLLLTPETCAVKSEPADGLYDERQDEDEFDRGLMERLGIDQAAEEAPPNARSPSPLAPPRDDEIDDYIPDDFDLPDALGPNPGAAPPRAPARAAPPPVAARPPPVAAPARAPPAPAPPPPDDDDPFDDIDEDALIAAAEADAAEEELALIREYEPPPPSPARPPIAARPPPSLARPARPPPPRASAAAQAPLFVPPPRPSRSTAQPSQTQAGPSSSSSRRLPAAPRPPRPASPDKPLFPPFTIASGSGAKRPTAAGTSKASSSSQRPTSQLEPLIISSSPEPEPAAPPPPRKKAPLKREATALAAGGSSARGGSAGATATAAAGKRIEGQLKPSVEVIEID